MYIGGAAVLPTAAMFSLFWTVTLTRATHGWQEPDWATYFRKTYLARRTFSNGEEGVGAQWWYGAAAPLELGHGPWALPLEQANGHLKERLKNVRKGANMVEVVQEIRKVSALWGRDPEDRERAYSRKAPSSKCSMVGPTEPSEWMLGVHGRVCRSDMFQGKTRQRVRGIEAILRSHYKTKGGTAPTVLKQDSVKGIKTWYCMRIVRPGPVPAKMFKEMLLQSRCKRPSQLLPLWAECGIIEVPEEEPQAAGAPASVAAAPPGAGALPAAAAAEPAVAAPSAPPIPARASAAAPAAVAGTQ